MKKTTKTDPKKKKGSAKKSTTKKKSITNTQQISDKLASKVAKGTMSYRQANKLQRKADSVAMSTTHVKKKVSGSSQNLPSKWKTTKAKHSRDRQGNIKSN